MNEIGERDTLSCALCRRCYLALPDKENKLSEQNQNSNHAGNPSQVDIGRNEGKPKLTLPGRKRGGLKDITLGRVGRFAVNGNIPAGHVELPAK
jgi:hypothetical protein